MQQLMTVTAQIWLITKIYFKTGIAITDVKFFGIVIFINAYTFSNINSIITQRFHIK